MDFPAFLKRFRAQKNITSARALYEFLGGEKTLRMSLRHFQLIDSGKWPPPEKLAVALFHIVPAQERRTVVLAHLRSVFAAREGAEAEPLLSYVEQNLLSAEESEAKSIWETVSRYQTYSDEQLDFLLNNSDALRFYMGLILLEDCSLELCKLPKSKLKKLCDMELVRISKNKILPSIKFMKLPRYEDSSPRSVAKATDFILKHLELFVAKEGAPNQELSFTFQMVTPDAAEKINERAKSLKKYIQSLGSRDVSEKVTPFLYVSLAKRIDIKELF
jgi:hypothetical protein